MPMTPPRNKLLSGLGGGGPVAVDSPLADLSSNLRPYNASSPHKGGAVGGLKGSSKLGGGGARLNSTLSRKDLVLPTAPNSSELHHGCIKQDWQGSEKFVRPKSSASISRGDRYIPNRESSRSSGSSGQQHLLEDTTVGSISNHGNGENSDSNIAANIAAANSTSIEMEGLAQDLEEACNIETGQRILSFSAAPPTSSAGPDVRSRYAVTKPKSNLPSSLLSSGKRKIPTNPERTLDAPNMIDDFYYNLLDWSSGNNLAVALTNNLYLWNGNTGEATCLLDTYSQSERIGGGGIITGVSWDKDGNYVSVGLEGGFVQIWDVETQQRLRVLKPSSEGGADNVTVNSVTWAPDGTLNAGFQSGLIREYDVRERDATVRNLEKAHSGPVCGLQWRSDSALLASGGNDNVVKVWDRRTCVPKMRKENHQAAVKALAWCPHNNSILATGGGTSDRKIHFWNTTQNTRTQTIETESQITSLHWAPHYREIASTHGISSTEGTKGMINVWSHPSCTKVYEIEAHEKRVLHASLSPDGEILASVSDDEELKLWKIFEKPIEISKAGGKGQGLGTGSGMVGGSGSKGAGGISTSRTLR
ncbi:WD40 repeat-like protein [Violaceomyces palustris]|uniref:WD40 repeat-like protein n=1 Tax=Violaceomyces palustris TaxID=1673888 RepID=A0ACD0NV35_9BASI|nr:WD40 repeat-like protein [Violaceomyces palustris]